MQRRMTDLALAGVLSLGLPMALRAQDAAIPPVPPPPGATTPIPPPADSAPPPPEQPALGQPAPEPPAPPQAAPEQPPRAQTAPATPEPEPATPAPAQAATPTPAPDQPAPEPTPMPAAPQSPAPAPEPAPSSVSETNLPSTATPDELAPAAPAEIYENSALAERLTSMATGLLRSQSPSNALWRYASSLLEAATRLAPNEPRYWRFLIEAAGRAGDQKMVIDALQGYRKLPEGAADQHAQAQLIDAYLAQMQSLDGRITYLTGIVQSEQVAAPLRSFAAMRLAAAYSERMQEQQAAEAVNAALQLNFLNLDALRIYQQRAQQGGTPPERLAALLALLQSNPAQPQVGIGVARELADVGLVRRSLEWFNQSLELHRRMGIEPTPDVGIDYACELFINGAPRDAAQVVDQINRTHPDDLNAWLLKLILLKSTDNKEAIAPAIRQATVALTNRMATIRKVAGDEAATTRPVDAEGQAPVPDPMADLQFIAQNKPELAANYAPVAAGYAWLKIYFEEKPEQAMPFIKAVAAIMGEGNELVARLQGWAFLIAGNKDDATQKLSAVADRDPVAAAGLIRLLTDDPASQKNALEEANKLLSGSPSRLTGAFLVQALSKVGGKVQPTPAAADLEKVLGGFPRDWMQILDQPEKFYAVRIDPVRVSVAVGEPVLVEVSVHNLSEYPLTIGPQGIIHPDLWFDAQTRGVQVAQYPAEAFARLAGPMVLPPKASVRQVVRLDQSQLLAMLERYPTANFQIMAQVTTNPTTVAGQFRNGPAGTIARMSKLMERRGAPIGQDDVRRRLGQAIESGTPAEKIQAAETLTKFATLLTGPGASDVARQLGQQAAEAVRLTTNDPDPTVRAWGTYLFTVLTGDDALLKRLLHDRSWVARTLGIVATDYTGKSDDLFKSLAASDPEPLVQRLAEAALEAKISRGAATQPSDAPAATQPSPVPASATTPPPSVPATEPAMPDPLLNDSPSSPAPAAPGLTPAVPATPEPAAAPSSQP